MNLALKICRRMVFASLCVLLMVSGLVHGGEIEPYRYVETDESLNYLLKLPAGYQSGTDTFPLLLFLHGIAQKGSGSDKAIARVAADGPFRTMREGAWDSGLPLIVMGPQSGGLQPWWRGKEVLRILRHAEQTYRVDPDRIYLSGISMGGRSVWWVTEEMPEKFAAIVPASTWSGGVFPPCSQMVHLGVWAFHGEKDPLIGLRSGQRSVEVLNDCEPAPLVPAHLTVLEGVGHGQWDLVYGNRHGDRNLGADGQEYADIYRWMLSFDLSELSLPSAAGQPDAGSRTETADQRR